MLKPQSRVSLGHLTTSHARKAGALTARTRDRLRAVAQGAARIRSDSAAGQGKTIEHDMPRIMLRGVERC